MKVTLNGQDKTFAPIDLTLRIESREDALRLVHLYRNLCHEELINAAEDAHWVLNETTAMFIADIVDMLGGAVANVCDLADNSDEKYPEIYEV